MAKAKEIPTVDPNPDLPPAGYERDEVLRKRLDELEQKAEELADNMEIESVNPKVFEEDREILAYVETGDFPIRNRSDEYEYCWVFRDPTNRFGAQQIMRKRVQGWELIKRGDKEAVGYQYDAANNMYVGDVVAMRIRKDRWLILKKKEIERQRLMRDGVTSNLHQKAKDASRRTGHHIEVREQLDDRTMKAMQNKAEAARQGAEMSDKWIKDGNMPGASAEKLAREGRLK